MRPDHGAQQVQRIKEAKTILQAVYISASGKVEQDPTIDHIDFKGETEQLPYFSQIIIVRTTIILQMVNYFNNDCVRWQTTSLLVRFAFACLLLQESTAATILFNYLCSRGHG